MFIQHIKEARFIIKELSNFFEKNNINYWLARGVLRHYVVKNEFGSKQSDIDFHIWKEDKDKILHLKKQIEMLGYSFHHKNRYWNYKMVLTKVVEEEKIDVELVLLFKNGKNKEKTWHQSKNNMFCCPAKLFSNKAKLKYFGINIAVPSPPEEYLKEVYGSKWREENN